MLKKTVFAALLSLMLVNAEAQNVIVPSGSYVHGELAQTLGVSASDDGSTTVLIYLTGQLKLNNNQKITLPQCDLYGKASADKEAGRIYISTEKLSCKNQKGQFQDINVKGAVYDKYGRSGVNAQFLTTSGQGIATLVAGTPVDVFFFDSFKLAQ